MNERIETFFMKDFEDFVTLVVMNLQDEIGKNAGEASADVFQQIDYSALPNELIRIMSTTNLASNTASFQITFDILRAYHEWVNK